MKSRRRFLLAIVAPLAAAAAPNVARNGFCEAANTFHNGYLAWAGRMNTSQDRPQIVDAGAVNAFEPLPGLWRKVEGKFRTWVRGY